MSNQWRRCSGGLISAIRKYAYTTMSGGIIQNKVRTNFLLSSLPFSTSTGSLWSKADGDFLKWCVKEISKLKHDGTYRHELQLWRCNNHDEYTLFGTFVCSTALTCFKLTKVCNAQ